MAKKKLPPKKQSGFSLTELLISLTIFGIVSTVAGRIYYNMSVKENIGNAVDVLKTQDDMAAKYLNERYDETYKALLLINPSNSRAVQLNDLTNVKMADDKFVEFANKVFYEPCLIVQADQQYKQNNSSNKRLNVKLLYVQNPNSANKNATLFAGKNLKAITYDKRNAKIINNQADDSFIQNNWGAIQTGCPYISKINANSLVVDVTQNPILSSNRSIRTDRTDDSSTDLPVLSSNSTEAKERTMSTNLYLDATVTEANSSTQYYCDQSQVDHNLAVQKCQAYATQKGYNYNSAIISMISQEGSKCTVSTKGTFTTATCSPYTTSGPEFDAALTSCKTQQPVINGFTYSWASRYSFSLSSDNPDENNMCHGVIYGYYSGMIGPWRNIQDYQSVVCSGNIAINSIGGNAFSEDCGTFQVPAQQTSQSNGAIHKFKALNVGDTGVSVKSTNTDGISTKSTAMLGIDGAGVKAGYIMMKSNAMAIGSGCTVDKVGTMVQQKTEGAYTASQLVCSYNPDFCQGNGYCYTPMKGQTQFAISSTPQVSMACPDGLRVDGSWTPTIDNGGLTNTACAITVNVLTDGGMAYGMKSFCGGTPAAALLKIKCTSASTTATFYNCRADSNGGVNCGN